MSESVKGKVDADAFKAVIRALLNTPPITAATITDKRARPTGARKPGPKKRGTLE